MMLYKAILSLVAAFAAASSAAASATPLRRGDGGYPPPPTPPTSVNQCNTVSQQCCNQVTSNQNPAVLSLAALLGLLAVPDVPIGLDCSALSDSW
jgi:hypothetical protein